MMIVRTLALFIATTQRDIWDTLGFIKSAPFSVRHLTLRPFWTLTICAAGHSTDLTLRARYTATIKTLIIAKTRLTEAILIR